jgi:hypothetical protein
VPIEARLPDDPSRLSKQEAEALIEEAQDAAAAGAPGEPAADPGDLAVSGTAEPRTGAASPGPPSEPPSPDDGGD